MVDYRSRSRRVLAHLTRTRPQTVAALQGAAARGTLMAVPSPSGTFWLISLQGAPAAPCTLEIAGQSAPLPPATAGGALWCALLLTAPPEAGAAVAVRSDGALIAEGRLQ